MLERLRHAAHMRGLNRTDFYNAFFAAASHQTNGEALLAAVEKHGRALNDVLRAYTALIDTIDSVHAEVDAFIKKTKHAVDTRRVIQDFVKRADALLQRALTGDDEAMSASKQLTTASADVVLFGVLFKNAFKGNPQAVVWQDLIDVNLETTPTAALSATDRAAMQAIARANWLARGVVGERVTSEFGKKFESGPGGRWYVLRRHGDPIAFVRFDDVAHGRVYAGSFNVAPAVRSAAIGEALLTTALQHEASNATIEATVDPTLPVATKYIDEMGFVATAPLPNYLESGAPFLKIEYDASRTALLVSKDQKNFSPEKLSTLAHAQAARSAADLISAGEPVVARVVAGDALADFTGGEFTTLTAAGYVATRYFFVEKNNEPETTAAGARCMVFEKWANV